MKIKVGINGMGRIGRMIVRSIFENNIDNIQIKCTDDYDASVTQVDISKIKEGTITYEDVTFDNTEGNMHWAYFNQIQQPLENYHP